MTLSRLAAAVGLAPDALLHILILVRYSYVSTSVSRYQRLC